MKMRGPVYTLLWLRSAELSKAFGLMNLRNNICCDASRVQDYYCGKLSLKLLIFMLIITYFVAHRKRQIAPF